MLALLTTDLKGKIHLKKHKTTICIKTSHFWVYFVGVCFYISSRTTGSAKETQIKRKSQDFITK